MSWVGDAPLDDEGFTLTERWYCEEAHTLRGIAVSGQHIGASG